MGRGRAGAGWCLPTRRWAAEGGGLPLPLASSSAVHSVNWVKVGRAKAQRRKGRALLTALAVGGGLFLGGQWARSLVPAGRLALRTKDSLGRTGGDPEEKKNFIWQDESGEWSPLGEWSTPDAEHERWWVGRNEFDVPHRIIFTYSENMLDTRSPPHLYNNVLDTVVAYQRFWGEPDAPVHFLDDAACAEVIERVDARIGFGPEDGVMRGPEHSKRLADYFWEESRGAYKGDLCRIAALYDLGGYYFDVDIKVLDPVVVPKGVGLVSSVEYGQAYMEVIETEGKHMWNARKTEKRLHTPSVFQAFVAVAPEHPVLRESLRLMYQVYQGTYDYFQDRNGCTGACEFGTKIFKDSLDPYVLANQQYIDWDHQLVKMLKESKLADFDEKEFADVPRQEGIGDCDFFVFDPQGREKHRAKFYSRVPGAGFVCCPSEGSPVLQWASEDCKKRAAENAKKNEDNLQD